MGAHLQRSHRVDFVHHRDVVGLQLRLLLRRPLPPVGLRDVAGHDETWLLGVVVAADVVVGVAVVVVVVVGHLTSCFQKLNSQLLLLPLVMISSRFKCAR